MLLLNQPSVPEGVRTLYASKIGLPWRVAGRALFVRACLRQDILQTTAGKDKHAELMREIRMEWYTRTKCIVPVL